MRKRLYMLSVLLIAIVQAVLAQVTTSALTGKVGSEEKYWGCFFVS